MGALARARRGLRVGGPRGALPLGPLPLDRPRRGGGLARRLGHDRGARGAHGADPPRHAGLAGDVPAGRRARQVRRHGAGDLGRAASSSASGRAGTRPEHDAYGFPFPPVGERMDELERQLQLVTRHWDADGRVWPKPTPRPRLIVGGSAKPRTVRRRRALRGRVQHGLRHARGVPRAARPSRRGGARGRTRAAHVLADDGRGRGRDEAELDDRVMRFQEVRGRPAIRRT